MSYRCSICRSIAPPGQSRLVHTITRAVPGCEYWDRRGRLVQETREEIAREIPVCRDCQEELESGVPLDLLLSQHRPTERPPAPVERLLSERGPVPPEITPVEW